MITVNWSLLLKEAKWQRVPEGRYPWLDKKRSYRELSRCAVVGEFELLSFVRKTDGGPPERVIEVTFNEQYIEEIALPNLPMPPM